MTEFDHLHVKDLFPECGLKRRYTYTLLLSDSVSVPMMVIAFGMGHVALGVVLLLKERRERAVRLYRDVA